MQDINNTPKLRFPGFTNPWEQRKLGDEAIEILAGGDIDKYIILDRGKYPVIANALTDDGIVGYYNTEYRVKAPAVTITGRGDVGHAKARNIDFTPVVRLLSIKSDHDVLFLENAINTLKIVVESTGVPQLTVPQLANYEVYFPKSFEEEKKIGKYFEQLDHLITLHQRKCDDMIEYKKGLLQNLFPKEGETTPKVRFPGFDGEWNYVSLDSICRMYQPKTISKKECVPNGEFPVFGANGVIGYYDKYNHDTDQICISCRGSCGFVNFVCGPSWITGNSMVCNIEDFNINKRFFYYLLSSVNLRDAVSGGVQPQITTTSLSKVKIPFVTDIQEQQKIGSMLYSIDRQIEYLKQVIVQMKEYKKGLLQQMFV